MSANDYKNALYESIMHLLWRQWVSIGIAGHAAPARNDYSIDPESLILISSKFCRYDQRLFDAVADWLLKYGQLVNPTRIKALQRGFHHCDLSSLAYLSRLSDATFQGELHLLFREKLQPNLLNCSISELEQLTEERIAELPQLLYHI